MGCSTSYQSGCMVWGNILRISDLSQNPLTRVIKLFCKTLLAKTWYPELFIPRFLHKMNNEIFRHLEVPLVDTDPQPRLLLLHLGNQLGLHPSLVLGAVGHKDVVIILLLWIMFLLCVDPPFSPQNPIWDVVSPPEEPDTGGQQDQSLKDKVKVLSWVKILDINRASPWLQVQW